MIYECRISIRRHSSHLGFHINPNLRTDAFLFGEGQSRVVISFKEDKEEEISQQAQAAGVDFLLLGRVVSKPTLTIGDQFALDLTDAQKLYDSGLTKHLLD